VSMESHFPYGYDDDAEDDGGGQYRWRGNHYGRERAREGRKTDRVWILAKRDDSNLLAPTAPALPHSAGRQLGAERKKRDGYCASTLCLSTMTA